MPGCGMHSRSKLAEKARYNSLFKIKYTTTTTTKIDFRRSQKASTEHYFLIQNTYTPISARTIASGDVGTDT